VGLFWLRDVVISGLVESMSTERVCATNPTITCSDCRLGDLCLPITLDTDEISRLDEIVKRSRPLKKGEHLFRQGEDFSSVFAVRSGSVKSYQTAADGDERVTGMYLPGEILGMGGISSMQYESSAVALETASICEIPFAQLESLSVRIPSLQGRFFRLMSQEITKDQQMLTMLSTSTAEERVIALLLSISTRNSHRHLSATCFMLPMTRAEIGSYLGLTLETVSRIFSRLQKQELISVDGKEVTLLDLDRLREVAKIKC
jgi:CRP/FNR family transcriptional regulator